MILLRLISWQYVRKHLLRSVLTTTGIVLGVTVFVAMHTANQSVMRAFNDTVNRIAGKTQLQVTAGDTGFGEEVLEKIQSARGVRVAVPAIEVAVDSGLKGEGNLLILGVDMTGDRSLRNYDLESAEEDVIDDPLVFLAQPDSLIVTRDFAARTGLRIGSRLPMITMEGERQFTVRGILRPGGLSAAFGGNLAIMDIYAAQKVFGRGRTFDRIDLAIKDGFTLEQVQAELRALLGAGFDVEPPSGRGKHFESLLRIYATGMKLSSVFALFIGLFIIYNAFAIAVMQRRTEIGVLRALGATRRQIRALFLAESAVAGMLGSAVGVLFGLLAARSLTVQTSVLFSSVFDVAQRAEEIWIEPALLIVAMAIGIFTSMVAAWIPARNAARVDPVQALQKGKYQVLSAGENRVRRILALLIGAVSVTCLVIAREGRYFYTGYILMIIAALLLTPSLSLWLSKALRPPLKWIRPVEGALAADSLIQAPRRTSGTVAALMLSLSMCIALGGVARASYISIRQWLDSTFNPELFALTSQSLVSRSFHFPGSMTAELQQIEGLAEAQPVRSARIRFQNEPVELIVLPMMPVAARGRGRKVMAGDYDEMHRLAAEGKGVIISDNLAESHHLALGQQIEIESPSGTVRVAVAGILRDYSDQIGTIFLDRSVYLSRWKDDTVDVFRIYLKPGVSPEDARRRILERFAHQRLFVLMNHEVKDYILRVTDQWFGMTYAQIAIAVLVAVLGIVNTLTVSIADRRRELGVMRAVGGLAMQIRRTIWMEAMTIGAIGLLLGMIFGAVNLFYQLEFVRRDFGGLRLDYEFPIGMAVLLVPVILAVSFGSALLPANAAVRSSLVEALEYE
jgi:putative ABC transport system permease protein